MTENLTKCKTCNADISKSAKACPQCGEKSPHKKSSLTVKIIIFIAGLYIVGQLGQLIGGETASVDTGQTVSTTAPAPPQNDWGVYRAKSEMDGSDTFRVQKQAEAPVSIWLGTSLPELRIECFENQTRIILITDTSYTPVLGEYGKADVRVRIDDGKADTQLWSETTDGQALIAPGSLSLLKKLRKAKTLRIQFTPINASPATATFNLTGLEAHIPELSRACHWKP